MSPTVAEQRRKTEALRSRLIYHRKQGHEAPRLTKAYQRAKADLALLIRRARRRQHRVVTRGQWGAAPPKAGYSPRGELKGIGIHHSASSKFMFGSGVRAEAAHVREIQRWHFGRGFIDIGYAEVIGPSGTVFQGRPADKLGAGVLNHNTGTVHICLLGNYEQEKPTPAALRALERRVQHHRSKGRNVYVQGHKEFNGHASNACPGRNLLPHVRRLPGHPLRKD